MSNYLAIATVTATLQRILQAAIQVDVDGARVTTVKPANLGGGTPETGVNLFLYQVTSNPIWATSNIPDRLEGKSGAKKSRVGLDLNYLLTFYGNEVELEPQRLLGSVVRTMQDKGAIVSEMIRETLADSRFSFLGDSDLGDQIELMQIKPLDLSLDDISKIWSALQSPLVISIAYKASVVIIEGETPATQALPVRETGFAATPFFAQPIIERVISEGGLYQPILADSTVVIRGQRLKGSITKVRFGEELITPEKVSDKEIILSLASVSPEILRSGVQSLQIVQQTITVTPPKITGSIESNAAAFVLRPTITQIKVSQLQGSDDEPREANINVKVNIIIGKTQRVVLILNEKTTINAAAYIFDAPKRRQTNSQSITFAIKGVKPGEYLVRVQIDGAESLLSMDTDAKSPTFQQYNSPKVNLTNKRRKARSS